MRTLCVWDGWSDIEPCLLGYLHEDSQKGRERYSFEYDPQYVKYNVLSLDPDIEPYPGRQYPREHLLFSFLEDSCPDRWGRTLMKRREAIRAKKAGEKPRRLTEMDFLSGVYDKSRMGGLRFSTDEHPVFLSGDDILAAPPWTTLRDLESAASAVEYDKDLVDDRWLQQILAPGSSLGGARPKATVLDLDGNLWIAKFPSRYDEYDYGAWEKVVHDLADQCDLNTPAAQLEQFSKQGKTFLVKRFDRDQEKRIHFASAMTMLGKNDNDADASYVDIAMFLQEYGSNPAQDLVELWNRVLFNMLVSNTDDHLRNHGFLLTQGGWHLSPVYDVNPVPFGKNLALDIMDGYNDISLDLAKKAAGYFGVAPQKAAKQIKDFSSCIGNSWIKAAKNNGIGRSEIEKMKPAFSLASEEIRA